MCKKNLIYIILGVLIILVSIPVIYFNFYVRCSKNPRMYTQERYSYKIDKKYEDFLVNYEEYTPIPGLREHIIPQGITYSKKYNKVLVVGYHKGRAASVIFVLDYNSGNLDHTILLSNNIGSPLNTHVGGITTDEETLWLTDNYQLYTLNLDDVILSKDMSSLKVLESMETLTKGDYVLYHDNFLYVGEYDYKIKYHTKTSHTFKSPSGDENKSLIAVYDLRKENLDYNKPDYFLSVPDRIQGLIIDEDNNFILSRSFWSFQASDISTYQNPLNSVAQKVTIDGREYSLWFLDNTNIINNIKLPPMSEGITLINGELYVIFESASSYYKMYTSDKVASIIKLKNW